MAEEQVLCIQRSHFESVGSFTGFKPDDAAYARALLSSAEFSFQPRSTAENDPGYKQIIPYVVLKCGGLVFQYRRGASGTEARLRAKRSFGIGGHIDARDGDSGADPFRRGLEREVHEEVEITTEYQEKSLGFIYDPSTPVGEVHLGVVHLWELQQPQVKSRESALADSGFVPLAEVVAHADEFETWSQLILPVLLKQ